MRRERDDWVDHVLACDEHRVGERDRRASQQQRRQRELADAAEQDGDDG